MIAEELLFWLAPLDASADGAGVLCRRHADAMVVPRGWTLDDQRNGGPRLFQAERFANQQTTPTPARGRSRSHARTGEQLQIDGTGEIRRPALPPDTEPTSVVEELTVIHGAADARPTVVRGTEATATSPNPLQVGTPARATPAEPDVARAAEAPPAEPPVDLPAKQAAPGAGTVAASAEHGGQPAAVPVDDTTEVVHVEEATEPEALVEPARAAVSAEEATEPEPVPEPPADPVPAAPWVPHFDPDDDLNGMLDVRSPLLSRAFRGRGRR